MPDAPDDFEYSNVGEFVANLDSSELAARLYSPVVFGRFGQVIYMTDFTRGFSGITNHVEVGHSTASIKVGYAGHSGLCAEYYTIETDNSYCYWTVAIPYVKARYYTFDIGYENIDTKVIFEPILMVSSEGVRHSLDIIQTATPFQLQVKNSGGTYTDITDLEDSDSVFSGLMHMRATIDTQEGLIAKFQLNSVDFDVTAISYYQASGGYSNNIYFQPSLAVNSSGTTTLALNWIVLSLSDELG